jgi:mRNA interferase RelE/StbE
LADAWRVVVTPHAERDLKKLDAGTRRRILAAVEALAEGDELSDVRKLKGVDEPTWRLRVGSWRVLFGRDSTRRELVVLAVRPRGRAY